MDTESADILGGPVLLNARDSKSGWWSGLSLTAKSILGLTVFLIVYVVGVRLREMFLIWREKAYKLSMRRRHGIPDSDHRPFNVAYAAVLRNRQENEERARKARLQEHIQNQQSAVPDEGIRQRNGIPNNTAATRSYNPLPGRYESSNVLSSTHASGSNYAPPFPIQREDYNSYPAARIADPEINNSPLKSGPSRRVPRFVYDDGLQHGPDDEFDGFKPSRVDGEGSGQELNGEDNRSSRGWKRGLGDDFDDEDAVEPLRTRDKRQRKVSLDKSQLLSDDMDIDDEDQDDVGVLRSSIRGKKRDRAEAGSTFGGDDDDEDSSHEVDSEKARRHRKRRTYAKRKSEAGASSRGKKRDRELADDDSEAENEDTATLKASRKKRGKRSSLAVHQDDRSDVSMDESIASSARGRPKRSIGDEWESNGVKYKVGPNGQRLRLTLVKKERQRFPMPEDSQHPDREANLEVYVESWLTEEEYREAKDQQLLAWQDTSNKPSAEPQTPTIESQEELPSAGKNLLWKSTSANTGASTPRQITPPPATPHKQYPIGSSALHINPFGNAPTAGKRISSAVRRPSVMRDGASPIAPSLSASSLSDSTNNSPRHRTFSKWEKQDLEAKAMMKIREANRLKEEERLQKFKKEQEAAAPAKAVPTITVTKADDAKPVEAKAPAFSLGAPSTTAATDVPKKDTPNPSNPLFGPPKTAAQPPLFAAPPSAPKPSTTSPASTNPSTTVPITGAPHKVDQAKSFTPLGPSLSSAFPAIATPSTSSTAPAFNATNPAMKPTSFSFGPLAGTQAQPSQASQVQEKKQETSTGPSLLSRMAPATSTTSASPAVQTAQAPSAFGFGKPSTDEAPKTTSAFAQPSTQPSAQSQSRATEPSAPKFSFGFGNKPPGGAPATASSSSSSLSGAMGTSEAPKPATNMFSFSKPAATTSTEKGDTTASSTATPAATANPPKFNFGIASSSGPNRFGTTGQTSSTATTNGTTAAPAQSAFSGFGAKPAGESSSTTAPTQTAFSGFGAKPVDDKSPPASSTQSAFSGFGTKPASQGFSTAAPTPSASGIGTKPATTEGSAPASSVFGFGSKPTTTNGTTPAPSSTFGVGPAAGSSSTTAPASTPFSFGAKPTAPTQSAFGAPSGTSVFGGLGTQPAAGSSSTTTSAPTSFGNGGAFGAKVNGDKPSAFGGFGGANGVSATGSTASSFGATSNNNIFGGGTFGAGKAPESSTAPSTTAAKDDSKPLFAFGVPAASSTTPAPGAAGSGATTSMFGTTSNGASPFGGGFSFGASAKNTTASQPANSTTNGGSNGLSGFGTAPSQQP